MATYNLKLRDGAQTYEIRNKYNELVDVVIMLAEKVAQLEQKESDNGKENGKDDITINTAERKKDAVNGRNKKEVK